MNECPFHKNKVRADLPPLIPRIAALPVDERGYPIPYFVAWVEGKPEFRLADAKKRAACLDSKLCWVCGQPLGRYKAFTIGPMCVVNRTTFEPPAHHDCALWSAKGCPFLAKPQMVRRRGEGDELMERNKDNVAGTMIERNPGVTCVWITDSFKLFNDGRGGQTYRDWPAHHGDLVAGRPRGHAGRSHGKHFHRPARLGKCLRGRQGTERTSSPGQTGRKTFAPMISLPVNQKTNAV